MPHHLFYFSGPSGAGKTSIIKEVRRKNPYLQFFITFATRPKRPSEIDGVAYHFIKPEAFNTMKAKNEFLDIFELNGFGYGGTKTELNKLMSIDDTIADMSADHAKTYKNFIGERAHTIFIKPPSLNEAEKRMILRGDTDVESLAKRRVKNEFELNFIKDFDKVIVNDNLKVAIKETIKYIKSFQSTKVKVINSLIKFLSKWVK